MKTLSEMAASNKPTALTEQSFLESIDNARKLLDSVEIPRPLAFGYDLRSSKFIGEHKVEVIKKTWKERLFSWPWRPWRKTKTIVTIEPTGDLFIDHQHGMIYGHPVDIEKLERAIENYDSDIIPDNDSIGDRRQTGKPGA